MGLIRWKIVAGDAILLVVSHIRNVTIAVWQQWPRGVRINDVFYAQTICRKMGFVCQKYAIKRVLYVENMSLMGFCMSEIRRKPHCVCRKYVVNEGYFHQMHGC
jgi:hypothetical protein